MPNDSYNGTEQSPFDLKDKDIAHAGDINGGFGGSPLADKLSLIVPEGEEENRNRALLTDAGPRRRTLDSTFKLPPGVKALRYVMKFDVGEDIEIASPNYASLEKDSIRSLAGECKMTIAGEVVNVQWEAALDADDLSRQTLSERWEALYDIFQETEHLPDISEAIGTLRKVVEMTPEGDENLAAELNNLGISLKGRFQRAGDLSDIAEAISFQTRAVALTPEGHEDLPFRLNNLGIFFQGRFGRTGALSDITAAISAQARAAALTPDGHTLLPAILSNLGGSLSRRFEKTGDLGDIAESISQRTRAVQLTPKGHKDLPSMLMNLGNSIVCRFERMGNLGDIAESISLQTRAIELTPEGHPNLPSMLLSLGTSFRFRFERTGDLSDISEAVSMQSRALSVTPPGHACRPSYLNNLGNSFRSRFQLTHDNSDISQTISLLTEAVNLTPESHADLPSWLNNLGNSLLYRFEHFDDLGDISEAIAVQTRAVGLTPEWHADLPGLRCNLGNSYVRRFIRTNSLGDVKDGIYNLGEAVRLSPKMHADLPSIFINLAGAWYGFFSLSREHDHLDAAISSCKSAATSTSGNPRTRLDAAIRWAMLSNRWYPTSRNVLTAFGTALDLLALVAGLEQTVRQRYALIGEYGNLPGEAAAVASRLGRPDMALEWLEQGRCLVWGQQSQLRTPLDQLMAHNEALANRVIEVSNLLENAGSSRQHSGTTTSWEMKVSLEDEALKHSQLASEWESLLGDVRAIPGFETFLRPSLCTAILQHLPASGPVVALNAQEDWCDAIVLRAGFDEVLHIPLPGFTLQKAKQYQRMLASELRSHGLRLHDVGQTAELIMGRAAGQYRNKAAHDSALHTILKGLWDEVVKPILDVLGFLKRDKDTTRLLPRIWWCPTGPMSFLPLHAVGVYRGTGAENVADYAVSSYTPSVTALTQRVKTDYLVNEQVSGLFLTCQPNTPGAARIPGTIGEVSAIHAEAKGLGVRTLNLSGDDVTAGECLKYMEEYSSIHLACHGIQDTSDPLQSRFLFHKGRLDLNSIMQKNLPHADLAFLSACQTSAGQEDLPDEVVHLAAGMLAAGYRRVVSTMWEIGDRHAPQVASDFYQYLWNHRPEGSRTRFDGSLSAYALHHATQELRGRLDNTDQSLLAWMPFVHYGY